jgi:hypothetical protein
MRGTACSGTSESAAAPSCALRDLLQGGRRCRLHGGIGEQLAYQPGSLFQGTGGGLELTLAQATLGGVGGQEYTQRHEAGQSRA